VEAFDLDVVEPELPDLAEEVDELELPVLLEEDEPDELEAVTSASDTARGTKYQNGTESTFTFPFTMPASGLLGYFFLSVSPYWFCPVIYHRVRRTAGRTLIICPLSA
jgi:hypothetical protein